MLVNHNINGFSGLTFNECFNRMWKLGNCCDNLYETFKDELDGIPDYAKFVEDYWEESDRWLCTSSKANVNGRRFYYLNEDCTDQDYSINYKDLIKKYIL